MKKIQIEITEQAFNERLKLAILINFFRRLIGKLFDK